MDIFETKENEDGRDWYGSPENLFDILAASGSRSSQQRFIKVCPSPRILISQLKNLTVMYPERFERLGNNWQISPPNSVRIDEPCEDLF